MQYDETDFLIAFIISLPGGDKLTGAEIRMIVNCFYCRHLRNKDVFSCQGLVSDKICFVFSGMLMSSSVNEKKKYKLHDLHFNGYNNIAGNWKSLLLGEIADGSLIANGDTTVFIISYKDFNYLCTQLPALNSMSKNMIRHSGCAKAELLAGYEGLKSDEMKIKFDAAYPLISDMLTRDQRADFFIRSKNSFSQNKDL
jgi:hypothetical protein